MKSFFPLLPLLLAGALAGCSLPPRLFHASPAPAAPHAVAAPDLFITTTPSIFMNQPAGANYARDLADALADYGIPVMVCSPKAQSWRLRVAAIPQGETITPTYLVIGPDEKLYGDISGAPIPAQSWKNNDATILSRAASRDSADLSKLLAKINARIQRTNPHSLAHRTPRLFVGQVTGASGDGDIVLPADLTQALNGTEVKLTTHKKEADFSVTGSVKTTPATTGDMVAQLTWTIRDSSDRLVGQVTQLRELQGSATLPNWKSNAPGLTQEAASGVLTVIHNDIVKTQDSPSPGH